VGDKTISMWLFNEKVYDSMSKYNQTHLKVSRGIALHKIIRNITFALSGEAYLNFMGNEFGHPEWIDFPRKENNDSYHYCRRQWSLSENPDLRYQYLNKFDRVMCLWDELLKIKSSEH
jgi:1,4-alpha-glucan branching enzyme